MASPVDSFPRMRGCYLAGHGKAFHPSRAAGTTTGRHKVSVSSWVQFGWSHGACSETGLRQAGTSPGVPAQHHGAPAALEMQCRILMGEVCE